MMKHIFLCFYSFYLASLFSFSIKDTLVDYHCSHWPGAFLFLIRERTSDLSSTELCAEPSQAVMMTGDMEFSLLSNKRPPHQVTLDKRVGSQVKNCRFSALAIGITFLCLLALLLSIFYVCGPSRQSQVLLDKRAVTEAGGAAMANTRCGPVEGVLEDGVIVFKGIPYALPPVGARRWQAPQGLSREDGTCWTGTRRAKTFGDICTQPAGSSQYSTVKGSEDCLFLNVWTTSLQPDGNRPVMFWIHGGDLVFSSGNSSTYMPTPELTSSTDAVYVSLNYRLGPMGFLTLETLNENSTSGTSGNYGLMDMILALHWVRDNIRNFGGNPDKARSLDFV